MKYESDMQSLQKEKKRSSGLKNFLNLPVALVIIMMVSLFAGILMGVVWEGVCFLRYFGSPAIITDKVPSILTARDFHDSFFNQVGALLDLYNSSFPNNMRYGSGLGLIAGAFTSLLVVKRIFSLSWSGWLFRLFCGAAAGAIVGGRLNLVFNSDPVPFLWTMGLFAIGMGVIVALFKPSKLPHIELLGRQNLA